MAPHKGKARAQQSQPQPSDYEADPPNMDIPLPAPRSTEQLNLAVIRRHYPEVTMIHDVAPYAVLYAFYLDTQGWEKVGVEGSLFICELVPSPIGAERFAVFMLNRLGLENFTMEITSPDDIDFGEFIMMQSDQIYGLWIFSDPPPSSTANKPAEVKAKLEEVAARAKASREARERELGAENGAAMDSEQVETSVSMGRQVSMRGVFGQQREQEATWADYNHPNMRSQAQPAAHPGFAPTPSPQPAQPDILSQLFMKAKQNYNSMG